MADATPQGRDIREVVLGLVLNQLISRAQLAGTTLFNEGSDGQRNIDRECRYPENPKASDYMRLYRRGDIAARLVELWPKACWELVPEVYDDADAETETEFESAWDAIVKAHMLWDKLVRADIVSGIGEYGILYLGLPGAPDLPAPGYNQATETWSDTPPTGTELGYVRVLSQAEAPVELDLTETSKRYGEPLYYNLNVVNQSMQGQGTTQPLKVHWTRVVHLADNLLTSEHFGMPRLERGLNRLMDIRKVLGGSGEMFWRGGFPGLSVGQSADNPVQLLPAEIDAIKLELQKYQEGLQRYLALTDLDITELKGQISDPTAHVDINLRLLAIAYDVPMRILMGAEAGQLASSQDQKDWYNGVNKRRVDYVEPRVLLPLANRLVVTGVLPKPITDDGVPIVDWPDLYTQSENEAADVLTKRTQALSTYTSGNAKLLIAPLDFLVRFMGLSQEDAESVLKNALDELQDAIDKGLLNGDGTNPDDPNQTDNGQPGQGADKQGPGQGDTGGQDPQNKTDDSKAKPKA